MSNTIHSDILRGHINTIILRSLLDSNKYGEEVYNVIKQRSQGQFSVKKPTIYSALSRLEQKGCINSYWGGKETRGGRRKYYSITELGREIVQQSKLEWEYSREVLNSLISKQPFDLANEAPVDLNASTAKGRRLGLDRTNIVTPKKYKFADDETEAPQQEIPNLQATAAQVTKEAAEQETLHSQVQQDTTHQQQDTLQAQDTQHFAQNNDECREVNIIDTPQDNDKFKQILQANSEIQTTIHQQDIQHQQDQSTFIEHTTIIEKHTTIIETNIIQQDHQQADLETQQVANQPTEQQADQIASQVTDQSANQGTDQSEQPYAQDNQPEFVIPSHTKPVQTFAASKKPPLNTSLHTETEPLTTANTAQISLFSKLDNVINNKISELENTEAKLKETVEGLNNLHSKTDSKGQDSLPTFQIDFNQIFDNDGAEDEYIIYKRSQKISNYTLPDSQESAHDNNHHDNSNEHHHTNDYSQQDYAYNEQQPQHHFEEQHFANDNQHNNWGEQHQQDFYPQQEYYAQDNYSQNYNIAASGGYDYNNNYAGYNYERTNNMSISDEQMSNFNLAFAYSNTDPDNTERPTNFGFDSRPASEYKNKLEDLINQSAMQKQQVTKERMENQARVAVKERTVEIKEPITDILPDMHHSYDTLQTRLNERTNTRAIKVRPYSNLPTMHIDAHTDTNQQLQIVSGAIAVPSKHYYKHRLKLHSSWTTYALSLLVMLTVGLLTPTLYSGFAINASLVPHFIALAIVTALFPIYHTIDYIGNKDTRSPNKYAFASHFIDRFILFYPPAALVATIAHVTFTDLNILGFVPAFVIAPLALLILAPLSAIIYNMFLGTGKYDC